MILRLFYAVVLVVLAGAGLIGAIYLGLLGGLRHAGTPEGQALPGAMVAERDTTLTGAAEAIGAPTDKQILFGDLHVHTTFSIDAFFANLPSQGGEGAHPVSDACDFARYCSALDFWSINDHAEGLTPRSWAETRETIRQCNAVQSDPQNPDSVAFLGWEWTNAGGTSDQHYGHKNVVFRDIQEGRVPTRPIATGGRAVQILRSGELLPASARISLALIDPLHVADYQQLNNYIDEAGGVPHCDPDTPAPALSENCFESAPSPAVLFRKLREWGFPTMVIPHGTTWGFYTPPNSSIDKQLVGDQHDEDLQFLFELFSGHGNTEEYRPYRALQYSAAGELRCPAPSANFTPSCHRAGEIIRERCLAAAGTAAECDARAREAGINYLRMGASGHLSIPGATASDWLDAGQCKDCYLPAFKHRPALSAQYSLAISNFDGGEPRRFRWGFIGSSDNHQARPGTGYKSYDRRGNTESSGPREERFDILRRNAEVTPLPRSEFFDPRERGVAGFNLLELERQRSFFTTGGLIAVHAAGRDRHSLWNAMQAREVYATSGQRTLLWFDLLNAPEGGLRPMGSAVALTENPRFVVRAVGSLEQLPGCPDYPSASLPPGKLWGLCKGECYNPGDTRRLIKRIEVIRVRPQAFPGEPVDELVEDPWLVHQCPAARTGCTLEFTDPEFLDRTRDVIYYARAIEEPRGQINGDPLRCEYDDAGNCIKVNPCYGDYRIASSDNCLTEVELKAWSSPIFVDFGRRAAVNAGGGSGIARPH